MPVAAAILIALLALFHSGMGEFLVLRPLFRSDWSIEGIPPKPARFMLRFGWHLASVAWLSLAAISLDVPPHWAIAGQAGISGLAIFLFMRGHMAWALFFATALCALWVSSPLSETLVMGGLSLAALALAAASVLHVYWAFGGRWGITAAIPTALNSDDAPGKPLLTPPPGLTFVVAVGLGGMVAVLLLQAYAPSPMSRIATWCIAAVMTLRAWGDFRYVGFTKQVRETVFSRHDDLFFTPLVTLIAFAAIFGAL